MTSSGAGFEVVRQAHVEADAARLPEETARLTSPLEMLHRLRDERLRSVPRTAKQGSRWHARRLAHVDVDMVPGDDLPMIPVRRRPM